MSAALHIPIVLTVVATTLAGCDQKAPSTGSPSASVKQAPPVTPNLPTAGGPPPQNLARGLAAGEPNATALKPIVRRGNRLLWGYEIARDRAEQEWHRCRARTESTGHIPLIVSASFIKVLADLQNDLQSPDNVIKDAARLDPSVWLKSQIASSVPTGGPEPDFSDDPGHAIEPDESAVLSRARRIERGPFFMIFLPTTSPWEAFAYLEYGGWNSYPYPHEHVAITKHWYDTYGAELMIVTRDVIEMHVAIPPTDDAACRQLAMEQFGYTAGDLVYQGYESFGLLARTLKARHHWYFWWD